MIFSCQPQLQSPVLIVIWSRSPERASKYSWHRHATSRYCNTAKLTCIALNLLNLVNAIPWRSTRGHFPLPISIIWSAPVAPHTPIYQRAVFSMCPLEISCFRYLKGAVGDRHGGFRAPLLLFQETNGMWPELTGIVRSHRSRAQLGIRYRQPVHWVQLRMLLLVSRLSGQTWLLPSKSRSATSFVSRGNFAQRWVVPFQKICVQHHHATSMMTCSGWF